MKDPLSSFGVLGQVPEQERLGLLAYVEERRYEPGQSLFEVGDESNELLFLVDGEVEICSNGQRLCLLGRGDMIGGLSLTFVGRRQCDAAASGHVQALALDRSAYLRLRDEAPLLALAVQEGVIRSVARALSVTPVEAMLDEASSTVDGADADD